MSVPALVDYATGPEFPMYLNDRYGDCTCAGAGHVINANSFFGQGAEAKPTDADIIRAYSDITGFDPETGDNDNGAVMQDVLKFWHDHGIAGHKIAAYATVNPRDFTELKTALYLFGHVYVGIEVPDNIMDETEAGQPWTFDPTAGIEGGHCITLAKLRGERQNRTVITWGQTQEVTPEFWNNCVSECWVVADPEWIKANHSPTGLNVASLNTAYHELTGQPGPFIPTK